MKINAKKSNEFASKLRYSKEGLVPAVVLDSSSGELLMLAYANSAAVSKTLSSGFAWFYSRERKRLWKKGEESGNTMRVSSVSSDCDSDAIAYYVSMEGAGNACHKARRSCFVPQFGAGKGRLSIAQLSAVIDSRLKSKAAGSYTAKLADDRKLACAKISEEAAELVEAINEKPKKEVVWEACDLIYHALVAARARGVSLSDLELEFARRNRKTGAKARASPKAKARAQP
ncbi:MAG: bifunctional phosphoribosyl-AMP cyclohydrolase/phosphoribosyl-ATP diphosphatase HisIE [Candidatus Micrarchaeia archaeon]